MTTPDDTALTLKALAKIINAQSRGTLSANVYIRRLPTQIVLENTIGADRAWITKNFPGDIKNRDGFGVRKKGSQRVEEVHYVAELREATDKDAMWSGRPPRVEVWGIQVPHVCRSFTGHADAKGPVWKCAAYNCGKRITKTKARELGLLP